MDQVLQRLAVGEVHSDSFLCILQQAQFKYGLLSHLLPDIPRMAPHADLTQPPMERASVPCHMTWEDIHDGFNMFSGNLLSILSSSITEAKTPVLAARISSFASTNDGMGALHLLIRIIFPHLVQSEALDYDTAKLVYKPRMQKLDVHTYQADFVNYMAYLSLYPEHQENEPEEALSFIESMTGSCKTFLKDRYHTILSFRNFYRNSTEGKKLQLRLTIPVMVCDTDIVIRDAISKQLRAKSLEIKDNSTESALWSTSVTDAETKISSLSNSVEVSAVRTQHGCSPRTQSLPAYPCKFPFCPKQVHPYSECCLCLKINPQQAKHSIRLCPIVAALSDASSKQLVAKVVEAKRMKQGPWKVAPNVSFVQPEASPTMTSESTIDAPDFSPSDIAEAQEFAQEELAAMQGWFDTAPPAVSSINFASHWDTLPSIRLQDVQGLEDHQPQEDDLPFQNMIVNPARLPREPRETMNPADPQETPVQRIRQLMDRRLFM